MRGTVKWFDAAKGYGFAAPDDGGKDVFVHIRDVHHAGLSGIAEGDVISFDIEAGNDGRKRAIGLQLLERASRAASTTRTGGRW
jgi:CspA family cold shock protein